MPYTYCADLHTHTIASGHAYGTVREMAQGAKEAGLALLGLTDHGPSVPGACDPIYFRNVVAIPRTLYGVTILNGCEANVLPEGRIDLDDKSAAQLDCILAGIHRYCFDDMGIARNTDSVIGCMRHEKVRLISHPDDNKTPLHYPALVQAAKEYGVALEINNSSLLKPERRLGCVENCRTILRLCMLYRVPVAVNSDAHDPSAVGDVSLALQLLDEEGFDPALLLNSDREHLLHFLGITL